MTQTAARHGRRFRRLFRTWRRAVASGERWGVRGALSGWRSVFRSCRLSLADAGARRLGAGGLAMPCRFMAQLGAQQPILPPPGEGTGSRRLVIHKPCLWPCAGQPSHSLLFPFHLYCECPLGTNTPLCVCVLTTMNLRRGCAVGARSAHCGPGPCVRQDCAADPHRTYR